jgi:hypothetical protein
MRNPPPEGLTGYITAERMLQPAKAVGDAA